jgi:hypothetical protein
MVVLGLLLVVHLDRDRLDDRARELEADLGGGAELAVGEDDRAQVVEVLKPVTALFLVTSKVESSTSRYSILRKRSMNCSGSRMPAFVKAVGSMNWIRL